VALAGEEGRPAGEVRRAAAAISLGGGGREASDGMSYAKRAHKAGSAVLGSVFFYVINEDV